VTQMDEATQQNAALVEEATAAARTLQTQAGQLSATVAEFKLDPQANAPAPQAAPVAKARPSVRAKASPVATAARAPARIRSAAGTARASAAEDQWQEF